MPDSQTQAVRTAVDMLLTETFEGCDAGGQTWFMDSGRENAFLGLLAAIPADGASRPPAPGRKSIAQHVRHTRFHLEVTLKFLNGDKTHSDWDTSWNIAVRDAASWQREIDALRAAYLEVKRDFGKGGWEELRLASAIGSVAHAAYHLGAIRQMLRERAAG